MIIEDDHGLLVSFRQPAIEQAVCGGPEPEGSDGLAPYGVASPTNRYANKRRSFSTKPASHDAMRRPGGFCGVAAPDPIPNSAVKRPSAHDTSSQDAGKSVAARSAHRISSRHSTPPTPRSASRQRGVGAFAHRLRSNPPDAIHLSKRDRLLKTRSNPRTRRKNPRSTQPATRPKTPDTNAPPHPDPAAPDPHPDPRRTPSQASQDDTPPQPTTHTDAPTQSTPSVQPGSTHSSTRDTKPNHLSRCPQSSGRGDMGGTCSPSD